MDAKRENEEHSTEYLELLKENYYISGWAVLDYTGVMVEGSLPTGLNPSRFSTTISTLVISSQNSTRKVWNVAISPVVIPYDNYLVIILSARGNRIFSLLVDKTLSVGRMTSLMGHLKNHMDQAESGRAEQGDNGGGRPARATT